MINMLLSLFETSYKNFVNKCVVLVVIFVILSIILSIIYNYSCNKKFLAPLIFSGSIAVSLGILIIVLVCIQDKKIGTYYKEDYNIKNIRLELDKLDIEGNIYSLEESNKEYIEIYYDLYNEKYYYEYKIHTSSYDKGEEETINNIIEENKREVKD